MVLPGRGASIAIALFCVLVGCKRKEEPLFKGPPPPPMPIAEPVVSAPAPPPKPKDERPTKWLADLKLLVAKKATTDPKLVSGEGDATSICDAAAAARGKNTDATLAPTYDEIAALCAFDVPLVIANEALDHLKTSTSQASVRLMCRVSADEIAKARAVKPRDPKVLQADHRRYSIGRCH